MFDKSHSEEPSIKGIFDKISIPDDPYMEGITYIASVFAVSLVFTISGTSMVEKAHCNFTIMILLL